MFLKSWKSENIVEKFVNSVWDRLSRSWYVMPYVGLSRGFLYVWNPSILIVSNASVGLLGRILHVEGKLCEYNVDGVLSIIYAKKWSPFKEKIVGVSEDFQSQFIDPNHGASLEI
jgi:hypothetical protein